MADDFVVTSPPATLQSSASSSSHKLSQQFEPIDLLAADEIDNEYSESRLTLNSFLMGTSGEHTEPTDSINNWALESSGWGVFDVSDTTVVVASEPNPIRDGHPSTNSSSHILTYRHNSPTIASAVSSDSCQVRCD